MDRSAIITRIKIKMDEFTPVNEDITHPLDSYIQPTVNQAALELLKNTPLAKLAPEDVALYKKDSKGAVTGSILAFYDGIYRIDFPTDVIRVSHVRFPQWERSVYTFQNPVSPEAKMQDVRATRGGLSKPVVVLDRGNYNGVGKIVGYCYTHPELKKNEGSEAFFSEPTIKVITKKLPEELDDMLIEPLVLLSASKVFSSIQSHDIAKVLYEQYANNIMQ
jgi:hypothetical protein